MKSLNYLILTLIITNILYSQTFQNVMINNAGSPNEPSICINPKNLNQIAAGSNLSAYYYSSNGGSNWGRNNLISSLWGVWGDPCIVIDTSGNFYYFHLSNTQQSPGYFIDRIVCQKSTNGGFTWSNPGSYTYFNPPRAQQDKEWATVDFTHGPRGNWIYCTWTQFDKYYSNITTDSSNILFARSTDGGLSWDSLSVKRINRLSGDCNDDDNTVEGAVPCVGPNGEVYVAWAGPNFPISQWGIFFDRSTDGGNTWLENDIYVANQQGGWSYAVGGLNRCNGLPVTCCDISSGQFRGTIYINWTGEVTNDDHDVYLARSTDGGFNWSAPIRVNDDPPGKEQFLSWMTIDQTTGYLYFVFYDRRNYSDNLTTDVYMARSTNGGSTFTNYLISESPFIPDGMTFFGDYTNITASNGKVRPIWTRLQSGNLSIWTALIDFPIAVKNQNQEIPQSFNLAQNYPNPFNPITKIKFEIPLDSRLRGNDNITLKIYDVLGREVATIVNEKLSPGTYSVDWDGTNYPSGVYFYKLETDNYSKTKKMVLIK